jgi:predicted permease
MIRRALAEVVADWIHEARSGRTPLDRSRALVAATIATARVLAATLRVFDEEHPMRNLGRDFRFAFRRLRATPMFTAFAIVTLALGIGVTTGIYSAVHAVMAPPSGLAHVDRLVAVTRSRGGSLPTMALSWPEFQDFLAQQTVFDRVAGWTFFRQGYSANGRSGTGFGECVSGEYFQALGAEAQIGRTLQPSDDVVGAPHVAVIGHSVWRRLFDESPDAVGRVIKMNGTAFEIVGVARPEFTGLFNGGIVATTMWIPTAAARALPNAGLGLSFDPGNRGRRWILTTARLAPGRTTDEATSQVTGISTRLNEAYPEQYPGNPDVRRPTRPWTVRRVVDVPKVLGADQVIGPMTIALMTAVGLVLLVACTNLANLMLARSSGRTQECAVRLALGASRWRLIRESMAESLWLLAIGGVLAIFVARVLMVVLGTELAVGNGVGVQLQPRLDLEVLGSAGAATFLALLIAGLVPALHASRADVRTILATDSLGASSPRWRGRRYLIGMQVAVSVVLVAIAALCVGQVRQQSRIDSGVDFAHLALVEVDFGQQQYDEIRVRSIVEQVLRFVSQQPEVEAVSASSGLPVGIGTPGASIKGPAGSMAAELVAGTPDVLRTLGVSIVRGRSLDARDLGTTPRVAVISAQTAQKLFGPSDPLGSQMTFTRRQWANEANRPEESLTVVGVAADTDTRVVGRRTDGVLYLPWTQRYEGRLVFSARSTGDTARLLGTIQQALTTADADVAVAQALTGTALVRQDSLFFQVVAGLASVLGTMALVLALAGLYGILSFIVAGRTREIGIRIALGAEASTIRRQVLREGLSPVLLGLAVGLGLGVLARLGMRPVFLRVVPAFDMTLLLLVPVLFIAAGIAASHLPARRASRVDANVALRNL